MIAVETQSNIIDRFIKLNRDNLTISKECDSDFKVINASIQGNDVWALKCKKVG